MTPSWVSLLAAFLSAGIAFGAATYTQHRADRRAREERQQDARREALRWEREDVARTYDHRRAAYVAFITALESFHRYYDSDEYQYRGDLDNDDYRPAQEAFGQVEIYGSKVAIHLALKALHELYGWSNQEGADNRRALTAYLNAVRSELGIPDMPHRAALTSAEDVDKSS